MDLDSPEDNPIIVVDESEEDDEVHKDKGIHSTSNVKTKDASVSKPLFPRSIQLQELTNQLNELLVKSLHTEFSKILAARLKNQVHEVEIELPGDLKEIPTKLEDFTKSVISLISQVVELKTLQWELPLDFLSLPTQVAYVQAKLKTLDALPSLLQKFTEALDRFAQVFNTASKKAGDTSVPLAG
ncbi:hypothetical protein Tco_0895612 [Tanacetum coccineum]|uniref:Uncharacterized protein n=1 Tax=Tanacetum coccineum TaxID=301880 RepID=A0ABQ5CF36_9ASTR